MPPEPAGRAGPGGMRQRLDRLTAAANAVGSAWILGLMLLVVGDVLGRALSGALVYLTGGAVVVNLAIRGTPELVKLSIVGIVFLQLADTLRNRRHVRSTVMIDRLSPLRATIADLAVHLLGAALCAMIIWSSWDNAVRAWRIGEYEGEGALRVPVAPSRTLIIFGSVLFGLQFLAAAGDRWSRIRRRGRERSAWTPR